MKKKEILDEILNQIQDLKKDIRDLNRNILKLIEKDSSIVTVDQNSQPFIFQKIEGKVCPSCNLDLSKGNVCCMATNCPYRMEISCSQGLK